jgi:hypothetical protein
VTPPTPSTIRYYLAPIDFSIAGGIAGGYWWVGDDRTVWFTVPNGPTEVASMDLARLCGYVAEGTLAALAPVPEGL